jgi:hypothetical protein
MGIVRTTIATAAIFWGSPVQHDREALMDRMEASVQLPKGASPLNSYAKLYADAGHGLVIAVYALPTFIEQAAVQECSDMQLDGTLKDVPCVSKSVRGLQSGERRWISNYSDLTPLTDARDCESVVLTYDIRNRRFDEVNCAGRREGRQSL